MSTQYAEGRYQGSVVGQSMTESSTGTPGFFLFVEVDKIKHADGWADVEVRERTIKWWITQSTIDFVFPKLKRLGFNGGKLSQLDPRSKDAIVFDGLVVDLDCRHEASDKGEFWEVWDIPRDNEVDPLQSKKLKELDALFGAKVKQYFGNGQRVEKAEKLSVPKGDEIPAPPVDDDDIPF